MSWKNQVRPAREMSIVKTKTQSITVEKPPYNQLGLGVLGLNAGHHPASRKAVNDVRHRRQAVLVASGSTSCCDDATSPTIAGRITRATASTTGTTTELPN